MNDTSTYKVTTPYDGLTQFSFPHHKCVLSVGCGPNHYASWVVGERFGPKGSHHIPTSYEIGVFGEDGDLIQITSHDTVAGWQPIDMVQTILQKMERSDFNIKDLELFCE